MVQEGCRSVIWCRRGVMCRSCLYMYMYMYGDDANYYSYVCEGGRLLTF